MRIMVIYGTTNGHTKKISNMVAARLKDLGQHVELLDSRRELLILDINSFDAVIIAGSVHQGRYQKTIIDFTTDNLRELQNRPTMLISACLSSAYPEGAAAAQSYVEDFVKQTGLEVNKISKVASRIPKSQFGLFMDQIAEHSEMKTLEPPREDISLTDWVKLETEVREFVEFNLGEQLSPAMWSGPPFADFEEPVFEHPEPQGQNSLTSKTVKLVCGESICIDMSSLFRDKTAENTAFLSMDLPDWLTLNGNTGELTGIVPEFSEEHHPVEFVVYTIDNGELATKATIALDCCNKNPGSMNDRYVFEFSERDTVILGTAKFFAESGLIIDGFIFEATGLPAGLAIKKENGVITGTIETGAARPEAHQIAVSATDPKPSGCGVSTNLFFNIDRSNDASVV